MSVLLGRGAECSHIDALLADARLGKSSALVLCGEPGIGKTALLEHAVAQAGDFTQLRTVCVESESELAFHTLADVFRSHLDAVERLPDAQATALRTAFGLAPASTPGPADPFVVSVATLALLGAIAESGRLLLVLDDAHWCDKPSATALVFSARRLGGEGVVFLAAARTSEPGTELFAVLPQTRVGELDPQNSIQLFQLLTGGGLDEQERDAVHRVTRGNPLAIREMARLARDEGLASARALTEPVDVGPVLRRAFERRLTRLPASVGWALLVAAASDSGDLTVILEALKPEARLADLELAESAELIRLSHGRLEFQHPLLRSVIYQTAGAADRRSAHLALARAALAAGDADRQAWHLAKAAVAPDEAVAAALTESALRALNRHGYASAAQLFRIAASLTPQPATAADRFVQAGLASYLGGLFANALEDLEHAGSLSPTAETAVRAQQLKARIFIWSREPMRAYDLLAAEAAKFETSDPARAGLILAEAAGPCFMAGRLDLAVETAKKAQRLAANPAEPDAMLLESTLGEALALTGESEAADGLLAKAMKRAQDRPELVMNPGLNYLCLAQVIIEEYTRGEPLIRGVIATARQLGAVSALPYMLAVLSELEFRLGNWTQAYATASESLRLAHDTGQASVAGYCGLCLARVEAALGYEEDCRRQVAEGLGSANANGTHSLRTYAWAALGFLELGLGNLDAAVRTMSSLPDYTARQGLREPNVVQWRPDYIEALVRESRLDEAAGQLAVLEEEAARTRRPWARGVVLRCRGLLAAARRQEFASEFEAALVHQAQLPNVFELARTQLCFAEALRRQRQTGRARDLLREAASTFQLLGAQPWERRTQNELVAAGDRAQLRPPPAVRELTAQELQVALQVAQGLSNREVANQLFLSTKTVETHLARVYSKLSIRSRSQLTRLLATSSAD